MRSCSQQSITLSPQTISRARRVCFLSIIHLENGVRTPTRRHVSPCNLRRSSHHSCRFGGLSCPGAETTIFEIKEWAFHTDPTLDHHLRWMCVPVRGTSLRRRRTGSFRHPRGPPGRGMDARMCNTYPESCGCICYPRFQLVCSGKHARGVNSLSFIFPVSDIQLFEPGKLTGQSLHETSDKRLLPQSQRKFLKMKQTFCLGI